MMNAYLYFAIGGVLAFFVAAAIICIVEKLDDAVLAVLISTPLVTACWLFLLAIGCFVVMVAATHSMVHSPSKKAKTEQ